MTNEMADILLDIRQDFIKRKMTPIHIVVSEEEVYSARPKKGFTVEDKDMTLGLILETTSDAFITKNPHPAWENLIHDIGKHKIYRFPMKDGDEYIELTMVTRHEKKQTDKK